MHPSWSYDIALTLSTTLQTLALCIDHALLQVDGASFYGNMQDLVNILKNYGNLPHRQMEGIGIFRSPIHEGCEQFLVHMHIRGMQKVTHINMPKHTQLLIYQFIMPTHAPFSTLRCQLQIHEKLMILHQKQAKVCVSIFSHLCKLCNKILFYFFKYIHKIITTQKTLPRPDNISVTLALMLTLASVLYFL